MPEGEASPVSSPRLQPSHPQAQTKAQAPFDAAEADVILRTSDEVDFRVFKIVLSLASPYFKDMFGLPQILDSSQLDDPVHTAEDSTVIDKLLRFCYPCADPIIETLDELHTVIAAMMKYEMHEVVKRARQRLRSFAKSDPVAVFAISCRWGWEDLAKTAARASLALPLRKFDKKSSVKELKDLTGEQHQALLHYHLQCSVAATNVISDMEWMNNESSKWIWFTCQACLPHPSPFSNSRRGLYGSDVRHARRWFMDFIERSRAILNDCPGAGLNTIDMLASVLKQTHGCKNCCEVAFEQLLDFRNSVLAPKIDEELKKVSLKLTF
ncbi:hypothetical protein C8R44DRAFT_237366 [Mycena epipterygia]|nr:hypothetical protein C8R44DRAFT_237366 [Mycena epipterygia]